jgi:methylenetetrahydrofolate reductase (NADPH)
MRLFNLPSDHSSLELSFEFFPPKSEKASAGMLNAAAELKQLRPGFCSVTYGACGSNQSGTLDSALEIAKAADTAPAAHLTCVGASRNEIDAVALKFQRAGIKRIVALRGDPQGDGSRYEAHPDGYQNAADLVAGLRRLGDFEISVAAYPEKHPESASVKSDIDNLKAKFDAGANRAITQFFFDAEVYLTFRDRAAARGLWQNIVPGILPIRNIDQVVQFAGRCGATVPASTIAAFGKASSNADKRNVAIDQAASMCERLMRHGVRDFHFYSLNKADLCLDVCNALNLAAQADTAIAQAAVATAHS